MAKLSLPVIIPVELKEKGSPFAPKIFGSHSKSDFLKLINGSSRFRVTASPSMFAMRKAAAPWTAPTSG